MGNDLKQSFLKVLSTVTGLMEPHTMRGKPTLLAEQSKQSSDRAFTAGVLSSVQLAEEGRWLFLNEDCQVDAQIANNEEHGNAQKGVSLEQCEGLSQGLKQRVVAELETLLALTDNDGGESVFELEGQRVTCKPFQNPATGSAWMSVLMEPVQSNQRLALLSEYATFTAGISHDLNNILGTMIGSANALKHLLAKQDRSDRVDRMLDAIVKAGVRGASLTKELVNFGSNFKSHAHVEQVCLQKAVTTAVESLWGVVEMGSVQVDVTVDPKVQVLGTTSGLHQILLNLLFNAIDAANGKPIIQIKLEGSNSEQVSLQIIDNGLGISEEVQQQIFEPFFTTKKGTTNRTFLGGTGLGLANVKRILNSWGGSISVESTEGQGSVFTLHFQVTDKHRAPVAVH